MKKRIIPCLDIKNGRVVKGQKFENIQDVADPVELAKQYELDQADIVFMLDITGDDRPAFLSIVKEVSKSINIPLYIGGGIRSLRILLKFLKRARPKYPLQAQQLISQIY